MKIIMAPKAGFCPGVKRALELAKKTAKDSEKKIYTLGPLIHNPQVVEDLAKQGIKEVKDISDIPEGVIIIRSHGVGPEVFQKANEMGLQIVDATCPFVKKAHEIGKSLSQKGYQVVVVGDREHPEVTGILGWTGDRGLVVETPEEAKKVSLENKLGVISQTTQPEENFNQIVEELNHHAEEVNAYNTICHATRDRQSAAIQLAQQADLMIVMGGKNSANTQKLAGLCIEAGTPTHHIETVAELDPNWLKGKNTVGITAGASTPDWIIEEVRKYMEDMMMDEVNNEENYKKQLEEALEVKEVRKGEVVTGVIVQVTDDEVMVDIGGKSEGVIPARELSCSEIKSLRDVYKTGDAIEAVVISNRDDEGKILLSKRKADAEKSWDVLIKAMEDKTPVEGTAYEIVKGGLLVDVGLQAFMPASLVDRGYVEDLNKYLGQKLQARVIEVKRETRKVVLSRKELLEEEYNSKRGELWNQIEEGQIRKGVVKRLANFGAFVDIGGIDGLLHVSEMAWYRVAHPSEIIKENDELEVFVLSVDKKNEKVSLSLKKILPNPWANIAEKYAVGTVVTGKVVRTAPFGAFVELEPGVDALVHISQLSDKRVNTVAEVVKPGDAVTAKVIELDQEKNKISLSIKQLQEEKEEAQVKEEVAEHQQEEIPAVTLGESLGADIQEKLNKVIEEQ